MGSAIVTAVVEQKGQITTNPGAFSPSTSRPIEQVTAVVTTSVGNTKPVEQVPTLKTAVVSSVELSKPIEQVEGVSFNEAGTRPDDCFLEQKNTKRLTDTNPDTPIEQQIFVTNNLRAVTTGNSQLEQRLISRDITGAQPIQQDPKISNTINLNQFNFTDLVFPQCNSIKNPVTTNILWRIKDFGFPFDVETLIFNVDGIPVQNSSSFVVTAITNGLQLDYDPPDPFDFGATVTIIMTISDDANPANNFFYRCSWQTVEDTQAPIIELLSPECNETNVDVKEPVVFSVFDFGVGVNQDLISLSVEGLPVCSGLSFDAFTTNSGSGYVVTWDHLDDPFRFDSTVSVSISATDLSPAENSAFFVCCFQTGESSVPEFINWDPEQCASFADNATGLTFEVYGNIDGIDISTLEIRIDNKLRKVFVRPRILRSE